MLNLKATGAKAASKRRHEQADRASNPEGGGDAVLAALLDNVPDVGEKTGALAESLTEGSPDLVFEASGKSFEFGSSVPHAKYYFANTGTKPATDEGVQAAAAALTGWIMDGDDG